MNFDQFCFAKMASYVGNENDGTMTSTAEANNTARGGTSSAAADRCSIRGPEKQGRQKLCPHCLDVVSRATYYRHKRTFYDHPTKEWKSKSHTQPSSSVGDSVGGDCTTPIDDGRRGISLQPYY